MIIRDKDDPFSIHVEPAFRGKGFKADPKEKITQLIQKKALT